MDDILNTVFNSWYPPVLTFIMFYLLYHGSRILLNRQTKGKIDKGIIKSIILFSIVLIGLISFILSLPLGDQKDDITSLIGIVLSAVLGLSATTFIGNALAGIALKLRASYRPGDFITVNDIFGRVTELGLFHTEIQTVDRDLTSLPNMTLASNALKVTRSSGTFISTECSLGYDVNRLKVEEALLEAAKKAELKEGFVHIISLGDFSIVYRIHGLLENVNSILSAKSRLTASVIDALHEADIEIVSPNFMNQRQVGDTVFIADKYHTNKKEVLEENTPEALIFDKAQEAEGLEKKKERLEKLELKIEEDRQSLKQSSDTVEQSTIKEKIKRKEEIVKKMTDTIDVEVDELDKTT